MKKQEELALKILNGGGVIIFPTDTVYGIGCRFTGRDAIDRIHKIKGTPKTQQFPILVSNADQVEKLAIVNINARDLIKKYWPGGLTIILSSRHPELVSGSKKIGFRQPDSTLINNLTENVGPIIGTSANFHGDPTPRSYEELNPQFIKLADFVIKGKCKKGIESTVVDLTTNKIEVLRQGAVKL